MVGIYEGPFHSLIFSLPAQAQNILLQCVLFVGAMVANVKAFSFLSSSRVCECAGMLLERLDGKPVTKVLKQPYFHDCQFVYDLLYGVFTTLDVAQAAVGFHHADFRLANVSRCFGPLAPHWRFMFLNVEHLCSTC